jgi:hypothetical protein
MFSFSFFSPSLSLCVCFVCTLGGSLVRACVCVRVFFLACVCLFLCRCFGF